MGNGVVACQRGFNRVFVFRFGKYRSSSCSRPSNNRFLIPAALISETRSTEGRDALTRNSSRSIHVCVDVEPRDCLECNSDGSFIFYRFESWEIVSQNNVNLLPEVSFYYFSNRTKYIFLNKKSEKREFLLTRKVP